MVNTYIVLTDVVGTLGDDTQVLQRAGPDAALAGSSNVAIGSRRLSCHGGALSS